MNANLGLLEQAVDYALSALDTVTPELLARPTPCAKWDLRMLLVHACESVAALQEGLDGGRVGLFAPDPDEATLDPVRVLRHRLTRLLRDWAAARDGETVAVADHRLALQSLAAVAALEIAVHGWDICQTTGDDRPLPPDLAARLLPMTDQLVPADGGHRLFSPPARPRAATGPAGQLLALLGRSSAGRFAEEANAGTEKG